MSDAQLIESYRSTAQPRYLDVLFKRYMHLVYGVCMKYLKNQEAAADATQLLFEKLMTDLQKHNPEVFENWLYRVACNHCLMILRKDKRQPHKAGEHALDSLTEADEQIEQALDWEAQLQKLEQQITQLKPDQRSCIELFYLKKQSYEQIVAQTGLKLKEVKSHIQNGKRNLRIAIQKAS